MDFLKSFEIIDVYKSREVDVLNKLTAFKNVTLSMDIANVHQNDKEVRAIELLEKVGLD